MNRPRSSLLLGSAVAAVLYASYGCGGGGGNPADGDADPLGYRVVADIPYIEGSGHKKHRLDVYTVTPSDSLGNEVVFFVPGGAWRQGDKAAYGELGETLAGYHQFTVVVANYRLSNDEDGSAVHPMHVEDVAAAFAWVKAHIAEYHGDPARIYLFGQSAGAHLASLLATDGKYLEAAGCGLSDIRALISMSGAYDLPRLSRYPANPYGLTAEETLMFKYIYQDAFGGWEEELLDGASPALYAESLACPALVVAVDQDLPGFAEEAPRFESLIEEGGGTVERTHLARSDFSDETWARAESLASLEPAFEEYPGHYAELVAINTTAPNSVPARLVVDFIARH